MQPVELFQAAQARASSLDIPIAERPRALEQLRADAMSLFNRVPEPPLYRRADDPARQAASELLPEAERILTQGLVLVRDERLSGELRPVLDTLHAVLEAICHTRGGRFAQADDAWQRARALEEAQHPTRKFLAGARGPRPAFDKATGTSRYDPTPTPVVSVKLVCPNTGCKQLGNYGFEGSHATHRFECPACHVPFVGYFGELRGLDVETLRSARRFHFKIVEVGSGLGAQVDFEEASGVDFSAASRDLLAFLYTDGRVFNPVTFLDTEERALKSVVNLTNHRMMWVSPASSCFVATVAFEGDAPELEAFRAYRDDILRKTALGRLFIRGYYRYGPGLAIWIERHPAVKRSVRGVLTELHRHLP